MSLYDVIAQLRREAAWRAERNAPALRRQSERHSARGDHQAATGAWQLADLRELEASELAAHADALAAMVSRHTERRAALLATEPVT